MENRRFIETLIINKQQKININIKLYLQSTLHKCTRKYNRFPRYDSRLKTNPTFNE